MSAGASKPSIQVAGFGPAAMGLIIAADRLGVLDRLLRLGIVFLERAVDRIAAESSRFPWQIMSNSPARDFIVSVSHGGAFAQLLDEDPGLGIRAALDEPVWLPDIGRLLNEIGRRIESLCDRNPPSGVRYGTCVADARLEADGTVTTFDQRGNRLINSRYLVIATGAEECADYPVHLKQRATVLPSSEVLAGRHFEQIASATGLRGSLVIVGSSHSAFSVAELVLREHGHRLEPGAIRIACRRDVALYFPDSKAARACGASVRDVDRESGEVNRFTGLRGSVKELYLRSCTGSDPRVELVQAPELTARALSEARIVISATGYVGRAPVLRAADHRVLVPGTRRRGQGHRDGSGRVLDERGDAIDSVFGLGFAYPTLDHHRHERVGINCFHGDDGAAIVRTLVSSAYPSARALHPSRADYSDLKTWR
jgi:hypothetical protein